MSEDKIFYTSTIPAKENILSEVLKGAIDGILPEKIDWKSLATTRIYNFYTSAAFGTWQNRRLNEGLHIILKKLFKFYLITFCNSF